MCRCNPALSVDRMLDAFTLSWLNTGIKPATDSLPPFLSLNFDTKRRSQPPPIPTAKFGKAQKEDQQHLLKETETTMKFGLFSMVQVGEACQLVGKVSLFLKVVPSHARHGGVQSKFSAPMA